MRSSVYKILAKVLAYRLGGFESQNAFMGGLHILDSSLCCK